jgi:hypothetical protein
MTPGFNTDRRFVNASDLDLLFSRSPGDHNPYDPRKNSGQPNGALKNGAQGTKFYDA